MDISGPPTNYVQVEFRDFDQWMSTVHRNWKRDHFNYIVYSWADNNQRFAYTLGELAWVDPALLTAV